jgi:hypothetical protein
VVTVYDNVMSAAERDAAYYRPQHLETMKDYAYGIAKTGEIVGDSERLLQGHCLRGLEKIMATNSTTAKRRRNIVRSIVELSQMDSSSVAGCERKLEVMETLQKYVVKHNGRAGKAARERALQDEEEAAKIFREAFLHGKLQPRGCDLRQSEKDLLVAVRPNFAAASSA